MIGLCRLLEEHGEAIQSDLMHAGLSLRMLPYRMDWWELKAFIRNLDEDSAFMRSMSKLSFKVSTILASATADAARVANWQRSAKKGSKPPASLLPQGKPAGEKKYSGDKMTATEMWDRLGLTSEAGVTDA